MNTSALAVLFLGASILPVLMAEFPLTARIKTLGARIVDSVAGKAVMLIAALVGIILFGMGR